MGHLQETAGPHGLSGTISVVVCSHLENAVELVEYWFSFEVIWKSESLEGPTQALFRVGLGTGEFL